MDIEFYCFKCGQHVVIDAAGAGMAVQCPKCGQTLAVPQTQPGSSKPLSPADTPPHITKPIAQKRKGRTGLVIGLSAAALLILGLVIMISLSNSPSKGAYPDAYDLGYNSGVADAVYPADALTHSDAERETLARKIASGIYQVENSQVDQWVDSYTNGYSKAVGEYNSPSKRAHFLGFRAGTEMCQQGALKPSEEVLDAMARQAIGTRDSYMWKVGFEQGWSFAHGL
jgi:hypothetical protein